ncbi:MULTISPECIES: SsgA family sporulation/cell division regulator [Amycolatopsis]|uniref:SsgA family sporulation/cell division regulator n=1 Tax=Amycolatopsis tucumanensis TaxID=401106 RepID=A0ABP7J1N8_9PSEU|nr:MULTISPECIES: SsgA family sporulation/cell division regulator [Amycolatopsis]MCF6422144.1 SsgA family sporulation/cell division regulator [Amycolatopsis tucumanensis]
MHAETVEEHQFVSLDGYDVPVFSRWSYTTADPYAVTLSFRADRGRWVEWCFARDLLVEGLNGPAGEGDVRIRPDVTAGPDQLMMELESPDGYAIVEFSREGAARFIASTHTLVPLGAEGALVDVDGFIAEITKV